MRRLILTAAMVATMAAAHADVVLDGSAGLAGALAGPTFNIPESLGTVRGGNLLHSFGRFDIGAGESATFTTTSALDNVIARVTGGEASFVEGLVRLVPATGAPAFFFINPAGIVLSGDGRFEVPGSLHLSAADSLRFSDGSVLPMAARGASTLSIASPESFGFLPGNAGFIAVVDGAVVTAPGPLLTLDAADILVQGSAIGLDSGTGEVLRVTASGNSGGGADLRLGNEQARGDLLIRSGLLETISSTTVAAGDIYLQGGDIEISGADSVISAVEDRRQGDDAAEVIKAAVTNTELSIRDAVRAIQTGAFGEERPALVSVMATGNLDILDGARVDADTTADASAGAGLVGILVNGRLNILGANSRISAVNFDRSSGSGGLIGVEAGAITIEGLDQEGAPIDDPNAYAGMETGASGSGPAGFIFIDTAGTLAIRGNALIRSETFGTGDAGAVILSARDLLIDGIDGRVFSGIATNSRSENSGAGGLIGVNVLGDVGLDHGGQIVSNTASSAPAGGVAVTVGGDLTIARGSVISSDTTGEGDAGVVAAQTGSLLIDGGGSEVFTGISSDALEGSGNAGLVAVEASRDVRVTQAGRISSDTFSSGNAGLVSVISQGILRIERGGLISSDTYASGDAGLVSAAGRRLVVDGAETREFTGIGSDTLEGTGNAGIILVQATERIDVLNGGRISSSTQTTGRAGGVVTFPVLASEDPATTETPIIRVSGSGPAGPSLITAQAAEGSSGSVGNLLISATERIEVSDGGEINIENFATSDTSVPDGVLLLQAPEILFANSPFAATSSSFGNLSATLISVVANRRLFLNDSRISTEAVDGNGGSIAIQTPIAFLQNSQVTTSVTGTSNGNGGDIFVNSGKLILDTGFILANTAAPAAAGGLVGISAGDLFVSSQSLRTGGSTPVAFLRGARGLNVIQAAAPDGVNGEIILDAPPTIDVTGSLLALQAPRISDIRIGRDPCDNRSGSSLVAFGRGGPPCSALDPLRQR